MMMMVVEFILEYRWYFLLLMLVGLALNICAHLKIFEMIALPLSLVIITVGAFGSLINVFVYVHQIAGTFAD